MRAAAMKRPWSFALATLGSVAQAEIVGIII
jgi:hypothetical protein